MFWPTQDQNGEKITNAMSPIARSNSIRVCFAKPILQICLYLVLAGLNTRVAFPQSPPQLSTKPLLLKLLLLTGSGTEPSFLAMQSFLNNIGIPHDDVILAPPGKPAVPLPALNDATKGLYQGIILATGNLAVCNSAGTCSSSLSTGDWTNLDNYATTYNIRILSYYTFPEARYGLAAGTVLNTGTTPSNLTLLAAAAPLFPDLNLANPISVTNSFVYLGAPVAATGEQTTPIMQINGMTVGVLHTTATGEQSLALTFDNNPNLLHSLALSYGLINWVTKGVFLGARHIYLTPQVDDVFIPDVLYASSPSSCQPGGFVVDPTVDLTASCPTGQMTGSDLAALATWQDALQAKPQTSRFQTTLVFNALGVDNGTGAVDPTNQLALEAKSVAAKFPWINHTYDHQDLDCYAPTPNSGICTPATAAQSATEIDNNVALAKALGLNLDTLSMVTPGMSGLGSPNFIQTAIQRGIKYMVMDASTVATNPPPTNTPILNTIYDSVIEIPRLPTNIFYNTTTSATGVAGSLPDEYNYFYGPQGLFRIGGAGGTPFFATNQTYAQIIANESNTLLLNMLAYKANPLMFHQSNLVRYDGVNSLYTDLMNATLQKFAQLSTLPVISLAQNQLGPFFLQRLDYNNSGVRALWTPGTPATITITTSSPAVVPVTGFCSAGCESYGGQVIGQVEVVGSAVTVVSQ